MEEGIQKTDEKKQIQAANSKARADRVKECRKRIIQQQETEVMKKRKELDQSGTVVQSIDFYGKSTECTSGANIGKPSCRTAHVDEMEVHRVLTFDRSTQMYLPPVPEGYSNTEAQTEEFDYIFVKPGYTAPTQEYFDASGKVRFYTGLPSYDLLLIVVAHVAPQRASLCKSS